VTKVIRSSRDLLLLQMGDGSLLAVSCDAAGGIGAKPHDKVKTNPRIVGRFTARVALMELLAVGADPTSIVATLPIEPEPTGAQVLKGITDEVRYAGLGRLPTICSSEKNVRVSQTGVGVTVLGLLHRSKLKIGKCKPRDEIVAIGEPRVREEVLEGQRRGLIADTREMLKLEPVHEIIPVGSKGIMHEAEILAKDSQLSLSPTKSQVDLEKSAGPSCVLLCAIANGASNKLKRITKSKPVNTVAILYSK